MTKILFTPSQQAVEVEAGTTLLAAIRAAGVDMDTPCGGEGSCGKCIVRIASGAHETDALGILPDEAVRAGYVLACKTLAGNGTVTVEIPELLGRTGGKFVDDEDAGGEPGGGILPGPLEPLVEAVRCAVPRARLEDGLSDLDRLLRSMPGEEAGSAADVPLVVLRSLAEALRQEDGNVTVFRTRSPHGGRIVSVEPGDRTARHFGLAVDVGTTTVAVQLVSLPTAAVLATRTDYNAQIACGLDVISRIHYARDHQRLAELRIRVLSTINNLIRKAAQGHGVDPHEIRAAVVAGNTTMAHLLLGLDPEYVRLEPYTPTVHRVPLCTAEETGIHIHPCAPVLLCPSVGSYVGGDITAGLLCAEPAGGGDAVDLFMDIGTNGELAVGNHEFLITCACSAGPAFEGGGIEHGMRAAKGAIERVEVDPLSGMPAVRTIGGGKPAGICGSGMISLLAGLYLTGWVDQAGRFTRSRSSPAIRIAGRRAEYVLVPEGEGGAGRAIVVSEPDIENLIRAKAAMFSAFRLLLHHVGIAMEELRTIFVAGGFGRFLDLEQAIAIGLLPDVPREKYRFLGNTSLKGACFSLVSGDARRRMFALAERMTYVELNTSPEYMDQYTGSMFLPHTDAALFPSVRRPAATAIHHPHS